jgi:2'-5' RNA ligase
MPEPSLILTLALDEISHNYFTALRTQYFPKHCNYLQAHLTLFHRLPAEADLVDKIVKQVCERDAVHLEITGIQNMEHGVAFTIASAALQQIHKELQQSFAAYLISRDREVFWPHITIQNKVTAFKAKQTADILLQNFKPFTARGTGIDSWLYLGGPWEKQATYRF